MVLKESLTAKIRFIPNATYIFLMTFIVFAVFSPQFLSFMNLSNIMIQSCTLVIIALGMTAVMLSNGIDLSVGSVMS